MEWLYFLYGSILVRPRRWFFGRMGCGCYLRLWPTKHEYFGWQSTNVHWWILYKTIFKFFKWLDWDAWRPFCDWTGGFRCSYPLIARIIHRVGATTSGYAISGGECFHCSSPEGCQVELSEDETGKFFILKDSWVEGTQDGTDYRFCGTTICPKCGYRDYYEDGSL